MLLALARRIFCRYGAAKPVVVEQVDIIQVQDKYQVITNPFWSNWFFSIGGGASVMYGTTIRSWATSVSVSALR